MIPNIGCIMAGVAVPSDNFYSPYIEGILGCILIHKPRSQNETARRARESDAYGG